MMLSGNLTVTADTTAEYNAALARISASPHYALVSKDPNALTITLTITNSPG